MADAKIYTVKNLDASTLFQNNNIIQTVNLSNKPWVNNSMASAFINCSNLTEVTNINTSVTDLNKTFQGCVNLTGDIYIESSVITNATDAFFNTTLRKDVYIPFKDENSQYTATYNAFIAAGYDTLGTKHGVYLKDTNPQITYTLTINPTPVDAIVVLTAVGYTQEGNSITVEEDTVVTYTVSKTGYTTETNTITVTSDTTVTLNLTPEYYTPEVNEVIVNLTGSSAYEANTVFAPGRYKVEVAPGRNYASGSLSPTEDKTLVSNMNHTEILTEPFIVRAYCGSDGTSSGPGTNPYSGSFKVNGIGPNIAQNGIDVNHIFGAGGGNSTSTAAYLYEYSPTPGGGNSLGNGTSWTDTFFNYTTNSGAGSCLHLMPLNGIFGTNYLRAYHCAPLAGNSGSAYGGGQGSCCTEVYGGYSWAYRGGNSPYGTGGSGVFGGTSAPAGTGIGAGGQKIHGTIGDFENDYVVGAGAYFDGTNWIDEPGNLTNTGSSYVKITYLGAN